MDLGAWYLEGDEPFSLTLVNSMDFVTVTPSLTTAELLNVRLALPALLDTAWILLQ